MRSIPEGAQFILPLATGVRDQKQWRYHQLECQEGRLQFTTLTEDQLEDIKLSIDQAHHRFITGGPRGYGKRHPMVYWPESGDYLFFVESEAVALPEFETMYRILRDIREARRQPVERAALETFAKSFPDNQVAPASGWKTFRPPSCVSIRRSTPCSRRP